jgi:hypothetical protein
MIGPRLSPKACLFGSSSVISCRGAAFCLIRQEIAKLLLGLTETILTAQSFSDIGSAFSLACHGLALRCRDSLHA